MMFLASLLALLFAALAALHLYWAAGGTWAGAAALPKTTDGHPLFQTSGVRGVIACVVVALGLGAFAYVCLAHVALVPAGLLAGRTNEALLVIGGVFALRTIGDFKYVGIFRRVRTTDFARFDRLAYTPLCLILATGLAALALG